MIKPENVQGTLRNRTAQCALIDISEILLSELVAINVIACIGSVLEISLFLSY